MAVRRQGSPGLGCRTTLCPKSACQRALFLATIVYLTVFRSVHALRQDRVPVDRVAGRGDLTLRTTHDTSGRGASEPAGEGSDVISVQAGFLGRLDRQTSRQLHEQDHFPNGTLTDPEVKFYGFLDDDYLLSIKFLERWTPGNQPLYHRNKDLHWHDMCAESLGMPKVALLFLTRGPIHMEPVWEAWLREAEGKVLLPCTEGDSCDMREEDLQAALEACKLERSIHHSTVKRQHMFRVYSHPADPDFLGFQPGSVFQGSTVNNLLPPGDYYYRYELVEGVRSMLSAALEDRLNQRFIILCESCMPLYPPALLYMQMLHESKSRVPMDGFLETENIRSDEWSDNLSTKYGLNRIHHWKKGNQRNTFIRSHAELAVEDIRLVEAFSKDCTKCQVDERFFATLLAYTGRSHEVFRHAKLIYEDWTRATYGGHPHDWDPEEVHTGLLQYAREQHDCRASRNTLPLDSAWALFDSYSEETERWPFPSSGRPPFKRLTSECALLMRKFKPPTLTEVIALYQNPLFRAWNYTGPRCGDYKCAESQS